MKTTKWLAGLAAFLCAATAWSQFPPESNNPQLPDAVTRVSEHVYAIVGWPNVGIVVGSQGTLVVDTGLGPRNGEVVTGQVRKLERAPKLYLTTTHFHPEHASGEAGFPSDRILIRPRAQQQELAADGQDAITMFSRNAAFAPFLQGVTFRQPEILFDRQYTLDLGGVHVRLMWLGAAHTKGDEGIWIEEDRTLLSGDLGIQGVTPTHFAAGSDAKQWAAILQQLIKLKPLHVIPDHGAIGDVQLLSDQRGRLLSSVQNTH